MLWAWIWAVSAAWGQAVHEPGKPVYWAGGEPWVSAFVTPVPDRTRLLQQDLEEAGTNRPFRFAAAVPAALNPKSAGRWDGNTWFCEVYAPGATCLAFVFDRFRLPPGGRFFAYTPDRATVRGPFTARNNYDDFAIVPLPGDRVYLEYSGPSPDFNIRSISYGYKQVFFSRSGPDRDFGESEPCHVNTVCPPAADWQDEKRGTALLLTDDMTRWCSSSLINNVRQDGRPYVLTADHCLDGSVTGWAAMFNYESPTCTPNQDGPTDQTIQGATLRSRLAGSDFALIEFNDRPQNFYNVYFNGWNRQDLASPNATVIHHPAGDVKKISFDYNPVVSSDYFGLNPPNSHWKVVNYEVAATAPGSSGSPLFDHQSRIIGQLHGGESWCNVLDADEYGKFSYSWATQPQTNRQLKHWLDPDDTGVWTLDGAYIEPQPIVQFSASQNELFLFSGCNPPTITFANQSGGISNPTTYTWEFPGGVPPSFSGPNPPPITYPAPGLFDVRLTVCNPETCYTQLQSQYISVVESEPIPLPFVENFEGPDRWTVENPDNGPTWRFDVAGGSNAGERAAVMEFFTYQSTGQRDRLISPPLDFSGFEAPITLEFDYAYCRYLQPTSTDSLIVYATRNCGQNRTRLRAFGENGQGSFATRLVNADYFTPGPGEWCHGTITAAVCPSLDLSAFAGQSGVQIVFESYNNYQNNLWLDNIRVRGAAVNPCPLTSNFTVNHLNRCTGEELTVQYTGNAPSTAQFVWSFDGGTVVSGEGAGPYVVQWASSGNKTVRLVVSDENCSANPFTQSVRVTEISAAFEIMNAAACSGVSQTVSLSGPAIPGAQYFWSFGGGTVASGSGAGPYQIVWNDGGTKTVALDVANGSCTARQERSIEVKHVPKPDLVSPDFSPLVGQEFAVSAVTAETGVQFVWDFGGATATPGGAADPNQILVWNTDGLKTVSLRLLKDGCFSQSATTQVQVQKLVERHESVRNAFRLYPQPANNFVTLEWEGEMAAFSLYDLVGRQVVPEFAPAGASARLELSALPSGIYVLRAQTPTATELFKVVIHK